MLSINPDLAINYKYCVTAVEKATLLAKEILGFWFSVFSMSMMHNGEKAVDYIIITLWQQHCGG